MFVGFSAEQERLDAVRDALTRYTHPVTGAYYFVPSTEGLRRVAIGPAG